MAEEVEPPVEPRRTPDPSARASIVPRWLAWVVLIALLAAASLSTWQCATGATRRPPAASGPAHSAPP